MEGSAICEITGFAVGRQCLPGLCAGFWYQVCQSLAPYRPPCYECLLIGPGAIGRANYVFSQFVNAGECVSKISFWEDKIAGMGRYWFKLALGRHLTSQTSTLQFNPDFWETGSWSSLEIHVKGMIHCNTSSVYKMEGWRRASDVLWGLFSRVNDHQMGNKRQPAFLLRIRNVIEAVKMCCICGNAACAQQTLWCVDQS